jgi:hypothetical protein
MNGAKLLVFATAMMTCTAAMLAESLPAGVEGTWRITHQLPKKADALAGTCAAGPVRPDHSLIGKKVQVSDRQIVWNGTTAQNPQPAVHAMTPADFMQQYMRGGLTLKELGLAGAQKIEVIQFGAPGSLPFDAIVVRDPSTIYFTRCGLFTEAVHAGGFVAPRLPDSQ